MPSVSIIIPCYNEKATIRLLLEAIHQQTYPLAEIEVIIADGLSQDGTREEVAAYTQSNPDLEVRLIDNPKRITPAGLNCALDASRGQYIIRMDGHSIPAPDYVQRCVTCLETGVGDNIGGIWDIKSSGNSWIARSIALAASHRLGVGDAQYRYTTHAGVVDTVPFGAYKREIFHRIGKFDESLLTNEDYEFNARLRKAGGKIWLDPAIRSVYFARNNLSELARQYWRYGFWKWRMVRHYPSTLRLRQALPPLFVLSLLGLAIMSLFWGLARWSLIFEILLYLSVLLVGTLPTALNNKDISLIPGLLLAIITMHLSWGAGFLWSILISPAHHLSLVKRQDE